MFKSIKSQILLIIFLQIALLVGIVSTTLYLLNLRQHDYLILNLTGQLRVIAQTMVNQSSHFLQLAPAQRSGYGQDLDMLIAGYDEIVLSLKRRSISAHLIAGFTQPEKPKVPSITDQPVRLICTWNARARARMDQTADEWVLFRQGLQVYLSSGGSTPNLDEVAKYIITNEAKIIASSDDLAREFRAMMEYKLHQIKLLDQGAVLLMLMISASVLLILYRRIFRPLDKAVAGFRRVASGEFGHRIAVTRDNEIGVMAATFNQLSYRVSTLFRMTDRINQAENLDETLHCLFEEFPAFLPVEWIGLLRTTPDQESYQLDRLFSNGGFSLDEHEQFEFRNSLFARVVGGRQAFCSCTTLVNETEWKNDGFIKRLLSNSLQSIFYMPLSGNVLDKTVLVFAARPALAYDSQQQEFLGNIAEQVSNSVAKTIGMESLVISTVKGLAKLAESRDPETGDHLFRMSRYAAYIAQELGVQERWRSLIDNRYVRDIQRFAPMHDIGKVGINDEILLKPGKLDEREFKIMQQHPTIGGEVLRRCERQMNAVGRSVFGVGIEIAEAHHEKYDGSGYPKGLRGEEIPLSARIVALADVFDALTSKRPYKQAFPVEQAMGIIRAERGKHFDPDVLDAFERALPKVLALYEKYKHV